MLFRSYAPSFVLFPGLGGLLCALSSLRSSVHVCVCVSCTCVVDVCVCVVCVRVVCVSVVCVYWGVAGLDGSSRFLNRAEVMENMLEFMQPFKTRSRASKREREKERDDSS